MEYVEEFGNKILFLLNNPEVAMRMGREGRKKVLKKFSWEMVAKNTFRLYKKVLKK